MKNKIIDFVSGVSFEIEGEAGKDQTLDIDILAKIANSTQELINLIAKHDIDTDKSIDLKNFKLVLSGFGKASAVPEFRFVNIQNYTVYDINKQRDTVNSKFEELMNISHKGDYTKIKKLYPDTLTRNSFVNGLYDFSKSTSGSPLTIVKKTTSGKFEKQLKILKFKKTVRDALISKVEPKKETAILEAGVAVIEYSTKGDKTNKKIISDIKDENSMLSYVVDELRVNNKLYTFNIPLVFQVEKEKDYFLTSSIAFGIHGAGDTLEEAKECLADEFDYLYNRLSSLGDNEITPRLQSIKKLYNLYIKSVK